MSESFTGPFAGSLLSKTTQSGGYSGVLIPQTSASGPFSGTTLEPIPAPITKPAVTTNTLSTAEKIFAILETAPAWGGGAAASPLSPATPSGGSDSELSPAEQAKLERQKRFAKNSIFNSLPFRRLAGVDEVPLWAYEPDPRTFRGKYYYNTRLNRLYQKITTTEIPYWKQIGS